VFVLYCNTPENELTGEARAASNHRAGDFNWRRIPIRHNTRGGGGVKTENNAFVSDVRECG
jgi:hypothetical protein